MSIFLPKSGGYSNLRVYRISEIIYDLTTYFAQIYIRPGSRTRDQMEQAARSGKHMLRRLLNAQQRQFLEHGGIKELMYNARTRRKKS